MKPGRLACGAWPQTSLRLIYNPETKPTAIPDEDELARMDFCLCTLATATSPLGLTLGNIYSFSYSTLEGGFILRASLSLCCHWPDESFTVVEKHLPSESSFELATKYRFIQYIYLQLTCI